MSETKCSNVMKAENVWEVRCVYLWQHCSPWEHTEQGIVGGERQRVAAARCEVLHILSFVTSMKSSCEGARRELFDKWLVMPVFLDTSPIKCSYFIIIFSFKGFMSVLARKGGRAGRETSYSVV